MGAHSYRTVATFRGANGQWRPELDESAERLPLWRRLTFARVVVLVAILALVVGGASWAMASGTANTCSVAGRTSTGYSARCSVQVTVPLSALPTRTVTVTQRVTVTQAPGLPSAPSTSRSSSTSASPAPSNSAGSTSPSDFPDADNTGVPEGTKLTAYTGPMTITAANTVIDSKLVTGQLLVRAPGLVIKNSKIGTGPSQPGNVYVDTDSMPSDNAWSVTIADSEIDYGTAGYFGAVCCGNFNVIRSDVHGGQTAVQCDMDNHGAWCSVEDSWLHGQLDGGPVGAKHLGAFLSDGASNITVRHSTIACDHPVENGEGCTGDLNLIPHFAPITNVLIKDNLFVANNGGNAFCTYGGSGGVEHSSSAHDIVYQGNVFERGRGGSRANSCADYGPVTFFNVDAPGNVWSGNVWDNDGSPVAPDA